MSHFPKYVEPADFGHPWPAVHAGKTGVPEVIVSGGAKAVGKIVFTGNLIAGDTVTVNGKAFTCMASAAAGAFQFNVDTTLALSLASLSAKLNACTDVLVSIATYSVTDTDTAITASFDANGTQAGVVLASSHATVVVTQPAGGLNDASISMDAEHTQINFATAITAEVKLPDGDESQRKTIAMMGSGTANITSAKLPGAVTNYAMNGNDVLVLQFLGGKWRLILNDGAVAT